ncbi:Hypothetical Protein FCC1311_104192 [Hondaea fermentalgiana]|uniref:TLC domain-containing protein n=1 Tax=Hondaea fermentalgiana TaxID=2315210 RepID=A0A2R5GUF7_9STRA|nr:Hypothetical Protein FCC1311_104192 [Hondaea fermentalgiana]|eukprot:GBG34195.1 Hypothetical Protein FCC1311_104192 [Hondaea fermentalgiana]
MLRALIVVFTLLQANFWLIEFPRLMEDPYRSAYNVHVLCIILLSAYVLASFLDAVLDCNAHARNLSQEKRRKLLVHTFEVIWGSIVFIMLSYLLIIVYVPNKPDDCEVNFISLDEYVPRTIATLVEGIPESVNGFPIVNPGTHVLRISPSDAQKLSLFENDCLMLNMYWFELSSIFIFTMYIFELYYLMQYIRVSLMTHHLFAFGVLFTYLSAPQSTLMALLCIIQFYFAAVEQPTFVALILYRLTDNKRQHVRWFKAGAISFGLTKLLTVILSLYLMIEHNDAMPAKIVPVWALLLLIGGASQVYSAFSQWSIAMKIEKDVRRTVSGEKASDPRSAASSTSSDDSFAPDDACVVPV